MGPPLASRDLLAKLNGSSSSQRPLAPTASSSPRALSTDRCELWDATTGEPHGEPLHPEDPLTALAFNPDGRLLATGALDGVMQLWDVATGEPRGQPMVASASAKTKSPGGSICRVAFSPDGNLLATAYETDAAAVWDVEDRRASLVAGAAGDTRAGMADGSRVQPGRKPAGNRLDGLDGAAVGRRYAARRSDRPCNTAVVSSR